MAVTVLWDAHVSLDAVNVSNRVKSVALPMSIAELDATLMGSETEIKEPGLKSFSAEITFLNDFSVGDLDEDIFALWDGRTKFAIAIRKSDTDAIGTSNPEYQFTGFITAWNPTDGATVGELAGATLSLANTTVLTRATA